MTTLATREQAPRFSPPTVRAGVQGQRPGSGGMSAKDVWRIFRKRKWCIIVTFAVTMLLTAAATFLWLTLAPSFRTDALLRVSITPWTFDGLLNPVTPPKDIIERQKRTLAQEVKRREILTSVLQDPRVRNTAWFKQVKEKGPDQPLLALTDEIDVASMQDTEYIRISMSGTHRGDLAPIINTVAETYVAKAGEDPRRERQEKLDELGKEKEDLSKQLKDLRDKRATAMKNSSAAGMDQRRGALSIELPELQRGLGVARHELYMAETAYNMFKAAYDEARNSGKPDALMTFPDIGQALAMDRQMATLEGQLTEYNTRLYQLRQKFSEEHPQVKQFKAMAESLQQQIGQRRGEFLVNQAEMVLQFRQGQYVTAKEKVSTLSNHLQSLKELAKTLEETLSEVENLGRDEVNIQARQARVEEMINSMRRTMVADKADPTLANLKVSPVTIAWRAPEPIEVDQPKLGIMLGVGGVLGLLLGVGLAFLLEFSDTSVKSPSDLARRVDLPLLGMVPHGDDLDEEIEDFRRAVLEAPYSPAAEAFRHIRTNLLFSGPAAQRRSLMITSPAAEDGRTTVVMNLAMSMAQSGRRVLVIDGNFRQPALAAMYPQAPAAGLSAALVGQAAWRDSVYKTEVPNLDVLTSGPLPPNPAELLSSDQMRQLLAETTTEYDQVLVDGAPLMLVSDSTVLSTLVDGVILVVRAGVNSVGVVQRANDQLNRVGAHCLGVVLQGVRSTAGGYLRKNYEAFYEYHQRSLPEDETAKV